MAKIHPSAVVGKSVEMADDVEVGAYCVLEGRVALGPGTELLERVSLRGPLTVGRGNVFFPNVCVGFCPQDRKYDHRKDGAGVVIGSGNILREGVTIHRATKERATTVGDENYLMANSHVGHDAVIGNRVTMANGALLAGHVEVGDGVMMGGNTGIHQFCRIGRLAMMSGGMITTQDVPPFCILYESRFIGSLNLVGLRRAGLAVHVGNLKRAFDVCYREGHSRTEAIRLILEELGDDPLCVEFAHFLRESKRGVSSYYRQRETQGVEG